MHSHIQIFKHDPESRIPENIFLPKSKFQDAEIINTSSATSGGNVDYLPPDLEFVRTVGTGGPVKFFLTV